MAILEPEIIDKTPRAKPIKVLPASPKNILAGYQLKIKISALLIVIILMMALSSWLNYRLREQYEKTKI